MSSVRQRRLQQRWPCVARTRCPDRHFGQAGCGHTGSGTCRSVHGIALRHAHHPCAPRAGTNGSSRSIPVSGQPQLLCWVRSLSFTLGKPSLAARASSRIGSPNVARHKTEARGSVPGADKARSSTSIARSATSPVSRASSPCRRSSRSCNSPRRIGRAPAWTATRLPQSRRGAGQLRNSNGLAPAAISVAQGCQRVMAGNIVSSDELL